MANVKISELPTTGSVARTDYVETSDGTNSRRRTIAQVVGLTQQSDVTNLTTDLAGKVGTGRAVSTQHSLTGGGNLTADRTLALVNDTASPGNNMVYGTNGSGVRGWKADPSGGDGGSAAWAVRDAGANPASPYTAAGLTGSAVVKMTGILGTKTLNAPTGTFPAGRNWVLYDIAASGGPYAITLGGGITHDGIGVAPTISVPAGGRAAVLIYSDDGTNWRISGDYDFSANRTAILSALGLSTLKARFEIANPAAGVVDLLRENVAIGTILSALAWTDTGSLTAEVQIANKTGANDYTPTGAVAITGLSALSVTTAPARVAASGANVMGRSGTTGRILQVALSALSGTPTRLTIEVEYSLA